MNSWNCVNQEWQNEIEQEGPVTWSTNVTLEVSYLVHNWSQRLDWNIHFGNTIAGVVAWLLFCLICTAS